MKSHTQQPAGEKKCFSPCDQRRASYSQEDYSIQMEDMNYPEETTTITCKRRNI